MKCPICSAEIAEGRSKTMHIRRQHSDLPDGARAVMNNAVYNLGFVDATKTRAAMLRSTRVAQFERDTRFNEWVET